MEMLSHRNDPESFQEAINRKLRNYRNEEALIHRETTDLVLNPQSFKPNTLYQIALNSQGLTVAGPATSLPGPEGTEKPVGDIVSFRENLEILLDPHMH